jgi:hypothetical protein
MTKEQKTLLEMVAKELGGRLQFLYCSDKYTEHQKIVIEYGHARKDR